MLLKRAITRAAQLCSPGDTLDFLQGEGCMQIVVRSAALTVAIRLDPALEFPEFSADAKELAKKVRTVPGPVDLRIDGAGCIFHNEGGWVSVPLRRVLTGTKIPALPLAQLAPIPDWNCILQVVHAAAPPKDSVRQILQYVCFGKSGTGATDEVSIAFTDVAVGRGHLFPAVAFAKWPKGGVSGFLDQNRGWFVTGDEVRIIDAKWGPFPPIPKLIPDLPQSATFARKELAGLVQEVTALSEIKKIRMHGEGVAPGYALIPVQPKQPATRFVSPLSGAAPGLDVRLDGKRLTTALKSLDCAEVTIRWGHDAASPIRVESARYSEDIFPLIDV